MDLMAIFWKVLNMSIAASWVVLAVLVLRLLLKKAPKWIRVALWGLVAVRLVCPISFESVLSLIPSTQTVPEEFLYVEGEDLHRDAYLNVAEDSAAYESAQIALDVPVDTVTNTEMFAAFCWLGGMGVMTVYALLSYLGIKKKVSASIHLSGEIFLCDYIGTPFILGIWKPKIYLPSSMDPDAASHVLAHERAHLKRKDHWWKPLGFLLLTIHWFNPILWLAYFLLCRDIEMACDEKVIREMGASDKKAYSEALLRCSVSRRRIAACPLAFGEVGVKERVKSVLNYKKPGFWIILAAVAALVIAAVCFLTDPVTESREYEQYYDTFHTPVEVMQDKTRTETNLTVKCKSTSGPTKFSVELWVKQEQQDIWVPSSPKELAVGQSTTFRLPPNVVYAVMATPLEGKLGYTTFEITGEGDKPDPQLKFDLPGPNVEDMDVQEIMRNIRKFTGLEKNQNPYVNSYINDAILRENFDLELVHIPYFFDQDGKTRLSVAVFSDLAESCTLLGRHEWEEQNTRFLFEHYLNALKYMPQERIRAMLPNTEHYRIRFVEEGTPGSYDRVIRYSGRGIGDTDGWLIHLEVIPTYHENGGFYDTGEASVHLFYGDEPVDDRFILDAKILEISNKSYLVAPMPGSWELNSADQIFVPMQNVEPAPEPQVGDILRIQYDGQLLETSPAQIQDVFGITVVTGEYSIDAEEEAVISSPVYPDDYVTYSQHYINMAVPRLDGWEYEITEYNETTYRCGIRFRPQGETGWLNLQWAPHFSVPSDGRTVLTRRLENATVEVGSYLGEPHWRYMYFPDAPDTYTLWNADADGWLGNPAYQEVLEPLLNGIRVAEGILWKDALLSRIQLVLCLYDYDSLSANMNQITGIWSVDLERQDGTGTTLTFDQEGHFLSREAFASAAPTEGGALAERAEGTVYQYEKEGFGSAFTITLYDDGTFAYYEGALSSYMGMGTWQEEGGLVTLRDEQHFENRFRMDGEDLVFTAEGSTNFMYVDVAEGDRFVRQSG